jgi:hypothetical protein
VSSRNTSYGTAQYGETLVTTYLTRYISVSVFGFIDLTIVETPMNNSRTQRHALPVFIFTTGVSTTASPLQRGCD